MMRTILLVLQLEKIIKSWTTRFYRSEISECRTSKTCRGIVAGLLVLFLFYGGIAHAEAIYYWTKTIGGANEDYGQSVAVDDSGNIYVAGYFSGTSDFDPGAGTDNHTSAGFFDIFLTKINADDSYGWTKTMGGTNQDYGQSVAVDGIGNVYVAGYFSGDADFDPDGSGDVRTSAGLSDIFITKKTSNGSYVWTKTMGGTNQDYGQSVAVDGIGNVYVAGYFSGSADFDPDGSGDVRTSAGLSDIFITKINADSSYGWTKVMGGTDQDYGQSVAVDGNDNMYVTGYFSGTSDFDPGTGTDNHISAGNEDIFITKIIVDGSYGWTKVMGGTDQDYAQSVAVDTSVNVFVTGTFSGTADFDPGVITDSHTSAGLSDVYLTRFRIAGFEVLPTSVSTVEGGGTANFTVRLSSEPSANVTISVSSSDTTKGTVDKSSLIFTNLNWYINQTVTITSVAPGTQSYTIILGAAISTDVDYNGLDPSDVTVNSLGTSSDGSGGCFIATAAYGSSVASQVKLLREFRDRFLVSSEAGKRLIGIYYAYSPPIAGFIKKHDNLKALVRLGLLPVLGMAWVVLKIEPLSAIAFMLLLGFCITGLVWFKKYNWS